jgi:hypothetical protein
VFARLLDAGARHWSVTVSGRPYGVTTRSGRWRSRRPSRRPPRPPC